MFKVSKAVTSVLTIAALWLVYQLGLPTLSFAYIDGFLFISLCIIAIALNITMWLSDSEKDTFFWYPSAIAAGVLFVVLIFRGVAGSSFFNADTMYQQLGEVEKVKFEEMVKQIDLSQIPIVDEALAKKQADKKIGEDIALGSRVNLGTPSIQQVNGELIFVAPLEHSGIFKWNTFRSTPGYITVSASNPNKVNYVTELNGEKIEIFYQTSAYFGNDLKRYIRSQGYGTVGLTEYTFELNDEGRPYWVVTTYENRTIWGSPEATGVVIVDAQNGKTDWYAWNDVPEWVDIVQPQEFVEKQINNWGRLVHGWWNPSNTDKIEKTDLTIPVFVDGDCYYFTGMTSVGSDDSCVGFIMVNTRNKKAIMSYMSGATEKAAMKSAEGLVQDFGYKATEPLPVNINGIPTYTGSLKDEEGLIKAYSMVNVQNYSIAAKGNNLEEAKRNYMQAISKSGSNQVVGADEAYSYTYEGKVERISSVVEDGFTYYYLVVEGEREKIFTASYLVSDELAVTRDGDMVKISYIDDKNGAVDIVTFDNLGFGMPISESQQKRDEFDQDTSALDSDYNKIVEVNPELSQETWENMTEEEKAKMLEEFLSKTK